MTLPPKRMPGRYFALLLGALAVQGTDTSRLLQLARIETARFERADGMLLPGEVDALLTSAYRLTGRTDLGFELGLLIKLNSHDQLGYGLLSCRNFDHVLRLASRHYHLIIELFSMRYRRLPEGGEVVFAPVVAMSLRTMQFLLEVIAVSVQRQVLMLLGPEAAAVDFRMGMPAPAHQPRYLDLLPARFHFDERAMPSVTMTVPPSLLDLPLPMASPQVVEQIEAQLESQKRRPAPDGGWGDYVTMLLRETLGRVTLEDIARRMNISARTIDRNLKKEHLQFRELSQQVRFERASELLLQPGATVSGVAEQLGFSDAANFTRAFRRHAGVAPSDFRLRAEQK